jgi:hypothetical protein
MARINPKMAVSAQTNCTVLNQRLKDLLERMDFHISVSIDSVDTENYAIIRKNGQLDRVLENLRYFREYTRRRGTLLTLAFCPMPQNWRELPAIVDFCNEWEMPLMFTTVESPPDCSLSGLKFSQLSEIIEYLEKFIHPQNTPLQRQNRQTYQDQMQQISFWREAARVKELAGIRETPGNFTEFIVQIGQVLGLTSTLGPVDAANTLAEIERKLRFILTRAEDQGLGAEAEAKLIATQPELIIRSVPGLKEEELLGLFNSFVMPIK